MGLLVFLDGDNLQGKVACETTTFWWDSWISNKTGMRELLSLIISLEIINKGR